MQVQRAKNNSKTGYEFKPGSSLSFKAEDIENKILRRFTSLQQEAVLHKNTCSYDFRENEKNMVDTWEQIIDFLLSDVFNCCAITMSDLHKYTVIKNKIPLGLNNIIQQLRIEQKYVTEEDLKDDNFYEMIFPDLYPRQAGYVSNIIGGIKSFWNFAGGKIGCKEENDNDGQQMALRTDISEEDRYKIIPENSLIFNFHKFKIYCSQVLEVLKDVLKEKDEEEVIPKYDFLKIINERYLELPNTISERITLPYGVKYIDYALYYLMKSKKIILFDIESNNKNIECIKLLKNKDDTVTDKDTAVAKILTQIELLGKRIEEINKKIAQILANAKSQLKSGNKQGATMLLTKKKNYEKILNVTQNSQTVLEKQIFDLRNAESNVSITNVLKQCLEAEKSIGLNPDEFAEVTSDLKEHKDNLDEINNGMTEFVDEKENEELNKEMANLEVEIQKNIDLPNANNEVIDENKIFEDLKAN